MTRLSVLCGAWAAVLCFALAGASAEEQKTEWKPLMDGKTTAGWHKVGDGTWTVEDGAFVGRADKTKLYGLLVSDKTYKDFTVRFKFQCLSGDSGFYIRTMLKDPDEAHGMQVQVGLAGSGAGGIYESYGRKWLVQPTVEQEKKVLRVDDWNEMVIAAHGGKVTVDLNGTRTAELKDETSQPEGHFALQMHSGTVMHVMFKDIEIAP